ncbi:hypothetical protein WG922_17605 [Ramlibacter sp. AN1015]|uniref:hypothetical protein n=1 Tax=Ramlibacter sp. AN1015 TaxID=3133428 RepID=UPI0030BE0C9B
MELIELIVWGFAVVAVIVYNLLRQRRPKLGDSLEKVEDRYANAAPEAPEPAPPSGQEVWGRAPIPPEAAPREVPREVVVIPSARKSPAPLVVVAPSSAAAPIVAAVPLADQPTRRAQAVPQASRRGRRPFRTPQEVRQGIIAMTVLGPCRALQPYGQEDEERSSGRS